MLLLRIMIEAGNFLLVFEQRARTRSVHTSFSNCFHLEISSQLSSSLTSIGNIVSKLFHWAFCTAGKLVSYFCTATHMMFNLNKHVLPEESSKGFGCRDIYISDPFTKHLIALKSRLVHVC
jgi:hypothetical protein